ncbi:hypothetical protein EON64_03095, partial [archaeon]
MIDPAHSLLLSLALNPLVSPLDVPLGSHQCSPVLSPLLSHRANPALSLPLSLLPSSQPSSVPTAFPTLNKRSVQYRLVRAANVTSVVATTISSLLTDNRTQIVVDVTTLWTGGTLFCRLYNSSNPLIATSEMISVNGQSASIVSNPTTVIFSGLIPSTSYFVFCTTRSAEGNAFLPVAQTRRAFAQTTTACCKKVFVRLVTNTFIENIPSIGALSLQLELPPIAGQELATAINMSLAAGTASGVALPLVSPATYTFRSTSASLSVASTVVGTKAGDFLYSVSLSGTALADYQVEYVASSSSGSSRQLTILGADAEPPTPVLLEGRFSSDGSSIELTFDSGTNQASFAGTFRCSSLLSFQAIGLASCQFISSSIIRIIQTQSSATAAFLAVGSDVTLKGSTDLRAVCSISDTKKCSTWASVAGKTIQVQVPAVLQAPTVVLSGPSSLTACQNLRLDATSSSGNAGRSWSSFQMLARRVGPGGGGGADGALTTFLSSSSFKLSPPTTIPQNLLAKGVTYAFTATLCNFLTACGSATKVVVVNEDESVTPVVTIAGGSSRSFGRSLAIEVRANAFTQSCTGAVSVQNLQYNWSLALVAGNIGSFDLSKVRSTSQNLAMFRLPPFTLPRAAVYRLTSLVTSTMYHSSSSASVMISIIAGDIQAIITGGSRRFVKTGVRSVISASNSVDQDVNTAKGAAAGLLFQWSCVQIAPAFDSTCDNTLLLDSSTVAQEDLAVEPVELQAVDTTSRITVVVYDATRSASAFVDVGVTTDEISVVRIDTAASALSNVLTNKQLSLDASLKVVAPCTGSWQVDDTSIDLSTAALTPIQREFRRGNFRFSLAIGSNYLPQRSTLTFSLQCGQAIAAVTVTTNGPPLPGRFEVSPPSGTELQVMFSFLAAEWLDQDLPISYQFAFVTPTGQTLVIQGRSQTSYTSSKMPAGPASNGNALPCSVEVFDVYDASVVVQQDVIVTELDEASQQNAVNAWLNNATDASIDDMKSALSVASTVLNRIDCSAAPDCSARNRESCLSTSNTCGPCKDGFTGDDGDANTACLSLDELFGSGSRRLGELFGSRYLQSSPTNCTSNTDCNVLQLCSAEGECEYKPRACPSSCSGHGSCVYLAQSTGLEVDSCPVDDFSCIAQCVCEAGYSGAACSISDADLPAQRDLRTSLVNTLNSIVASDDITASSLLTWSSYLYSIASNPYELSVDSISAVRAIAALTAMYSQETKVDYTLLTGVLDAVDALASIAYSGYNTQGGELSNNTAVDIIDTLTDFADVIASSLVDGQSNVAFIYRNFRIISSVMAIESLQNVSVPLSNAEALSDQDKTSLVLYPRADAERDVVLAATLVQIYQRSFTRSPTAFFSDPIRLKLVQRDATDDDVSDVLESIQFTLRNNDVLSYYVFGNETGPNFTSICTTERETFTFTCPYSSQLITHRCTGIAGTHISYCPVVQPNCNLLNITSASTSGSSSFCQVVEFTSSYTVCNCTLIDRNSSASPSPAPSASPQSRRLITSSENKLLRDSGLVDLAASGEYVAMDFKNTFRVAGQLNDADAGKRVLTIILLFGVLWGTGLVLMVYIHFREVRQIEKERKAMMDQGSDVREETAKKLILGYIDSIIPAVYNSKDSVWTRFFREISRHHRYFHLTVPDTRRVDLKDRLYRTIKILSTETVSIFLQAVLFDLQKPVDDGSCERLLYKNLCLEKRTVLDSRQHYCEWRNEQCSYDEGQFSERALVIVIIICTICTGIFKLPLDFLLKLWVCPTRSVFMSEGHVDDGSGSEAQQGKDGDAASSSVSSLSLSAKAQNRKQRKAAQASERSVPRSIHQTQQLVLKSKGAYKVQKFVNSDEKIGKDRTEMSNVVELFDSFEEDHEKEYGRREDSSQDEVRNLKVVRVKPNKGIKSGAVVPMGGEAYAVGDVVRNEQNDQYEGDEEPTGAPEGDKAKPSALILLSKPSALLACLGRKEVSAEMARSVESKLDNMCEQIVRLRLSWQQQLDMGRRKEEADASLGKELAVVMTADEQTYYSAQRALVQLFDMQWGLRPVHVAAGSSEPPLDLQSLLLAGRCRDAFQPDALAVLAQNLLEVQQEVESRAELFRFFSPVTAGLELMHLFMIDLLGRRTRSAIIFRNKFNEDFETLFVISWPVQAAAVVLVLGLNAFFIYYTLLRGLSRGLGWQLAFLQVVLVQMGMEMLLMETVETLYLHYLLPQSVRQDVLRAVQLLHAIAEDPSQLRRFGGKYAGRAGQQDGGGDVESAAQQGAPFDACEFFFVSHFLATQRQDLPESEIVQGYDSPLPGMASRLWPHFRTRARQNALAEEVLGVQNNVRVGGADVMGVGQVGEE